MTAWSLEPTDSLLLRGTFISQVISKHQKPCSIGSQAVSTVFDRYFLSPCFSHINLIHVNLGFISPKHLLQNWSACPSPIWSFCSGALPVSCTLWRKLSYDCRLWQRWVYFPESVLYFPRCCKRLLLYHGQNSVVFSLSCFSGHLLLLILSFKVCSRQFYWPLPVFFVYLCILFSLMMTFLALHFGL